jgi:hypothetical protein
MPLPNKDTLIRVPRGDRQGDRGLKPFTAIAALNESKEPCAQAALIGCFVRPEEVAFAVMLPKKTRWLDKCSCLTRDVVLRGIA